MRRPAGAAAEHNALVLPVDTKSPFPWSGVLFGLALILSPAYWIGNQSIVQRSLGARSEFEAKAAYVWGALLKNVIPLVVAAPGLVAFALYPNLADGDDAFPTLVARLLPVGLKGLFLAAFLAALMSSVDSYLNAAATIWTNDVYQRFFSRQASPRKLLKIGRLTTLVLVIWGVVFAIWIHRMSDRLGGVYAIFQTLMAFFQGPALAILLAGMFWRRANGLGAFVGFCGGVLCAVGLFIFNQPDVYQRLGWRPLFQISEPFLYFSMWAFLVTCGLLVLVSLATRPEPAEKSAALVYRRSSKS